MHNSETLKTRLNADHQTQHIVLAVENRFYKFFGSYSKIVLTRQNTAYQANWRHARLIDLSGVTGVAELFSGDRGRGYCRHPDEAATVPACLYTGTDRHPWLGGYFNG